MRLAGRRLALATLVVMVIAAGIIVLLVKPGGKATNQPPTNTYTDPYSHETVTYIQGKAPDTYGSDSSNPVYLGFDKLLDHGISYDQLGALKTAFNNYSKNQTTPVKEVSIDVDHVTTTKEGSSFYLNFKAVINRKNIFQAKVDDSGLSAVRLYLTDNTGKLIYDSQAVYNQVAE